jgi:transcriptional regulator with XRE-family HTH domain
MKAKDLAQTLGVTPQTISHWENGKQPIGEAYDRLLRAIYIASVPEIGQHNIIDVLKEMPRSRRTFDGKEEIALNPQEWMGGQTGNCCPAS